MAKIFERTDRETSLPQRVGVRRRDLFEYQGSCLHLVQCDQRQCQRVASMPSRPESVMSISTAS